jgi:hypothetical protein
MTNWQKEERQQQKDLLTRYEDLIPKYWENLEYHNTVICSKEIEDRALLEDLTILRRFKEQFK